MTKVTGKLTVFFEEPLWAGVFERVERKKLSACKVIFDAETKGETQGQIMSLVS